MANIGFTGKDNFQWWIGQVAINQLDDRYNPDGWDRVHVRIIGVHDKKGTKIKDADLPWAIVERPPSQGSYNRGSLGLSGGEWVRGYFLDPYNQIPVITAVLTRSASTDLVDLNDVKTNKSTEFNNVSIYNAGFSAKAHRVIGGAKPSGPATPTRPEFDAAKKSIGNQG